MNSCKSCDDSTSCKYNDVEKKCINCRYELVYIGIKDIDPCNECKDFSNFVYYAIGQSL